MGSEPKNTKKEESKKREDPDELLPPFFPSWRAAYLFVIGFLLFLILLFYLFTKAYA